MKSPRRSFVFIATLALGFAALAQTTPPAAEKAPAQTSTQPVPPAPAPKRPIVSTVIDTNKLEVKPTATGSRRDVFNGPTATLNNLESHITTVNPGQSAHPPHTHGNDEMLLVKEGKLEVTIKGQTYLAVPGSIIFYESNDLHGTKNVGDVPVTYYVFDWVTDKTPKTIPPPAAPTAATTPTAAK